MKKLLIALLFPGFVQGAEVIYAPSADTPTYSVVIVDSRKLKTTLRDALAQYPGEECLPAGDLNASLHCPGLSIAGGVSYNFIGGFPKWPDPKDPRKELRIDGLKTKSFANYVTPGACTVDSAGNVIFCPTVPPPKPVVVTFNRPTTEFGFMFLPLREGVDAPFISGFNVSVNGADLGYYPVAPSGVQYIGVTAPEGLLTATFTGVSVVDANLVGPWFGHRLYYK